jgi:two-component system, response regulator PdtaR
VGTWSVILLVAEDEALVALVLGLELGDAGHRVLGPAATVEDALALAAETRPELALIDIRLKDGGDGIALARTLRDRHGVPALFVSGQAPDALAARDAALGLVRKPYAPEDVARAVEAVAELLRGRRPARLPPGLELFGGTEP